MSDDEATQVLAPVAANGHSQNVLEVLRARRAAMRGERYFDVELPEYEGLLVLRLQPINGPTFAKLLARRDKSKSPERDFNANADTMIAAYHSLQARAEPDGELEVLTYPDGDDAQLDDRLPDALGFTVTTDSAREVLLGLFAGAPAPYMSLGRACAEYVTWMTALDAEGEGLGESPAAPR